MAYDNEVYLDLGDADLTVSAELSPADKTTVWSGSAFVAVSTLDAAGWAAGLLPLTEQVLSDATSSGRYVLQAANWPSGLAAGEYTLRCFSGANPSPDDADVGTVVVVWDGTKVITVLNASVSIGSAWYITLNTLNVGEAPRVNITAYQYAKIGPITLTCENDQTGDSHSLLVYEPGTDVALWSLTTGNNELSASGTSVVIDADDAHTSQKGTWQYVLRNTTDDTVELVGTLTIIGAPEATGSG